MRNSSDAKNRLLALLQRASGCTFVRLKQQHDKISQIYEFGDESHSHQVDVHAQQHERNEDSFENGSVQKLHGYHLAITIISQQLIKIVVSHELEQQSIDADSRRTFVAKNPVLTQYTLSLYHPESLPQFLLDATEGDEWVTDLSQQITHTEQQQFDTFLNAIIATIEGLERIEDYDIITSDNLTKLQSRSSLQREIDQRINSTNLALCMIHCIDFQQVNRKFGQAKGDEVLREIAKVILSYTRTDDIPGRFGGALFGIAISAQSIEDGYKLAVKLQNAMHEKPYLSNAIRLSFSVGVAFVDHQEVMTQNVSASNLLINRAEQALKAAQSSIQKQHVKGKSQQNASTIVRWEAEKFKLDTQEFNYFGGIFTADNVTNYRNMLLLWDISSIIADEAHFNNLLKNVIERLGYTFEFEFAGLVSLADDTPTQYCFELLDNGELQSLEFSLCHYRDNIIQTAKKAIDESTHTEYSENGNRAIIIPVGTDNQECFYVIGNRAKLEFTHESVMLFIGFARQIGKALKRSQLEEELNKQLEEQNAELEKELMDLKAGMQSSSLVYRSSIMQDVVEHTQRAAQSDTTVLISGESGTGKEKLIHTLHALGPRSKQALVIVDCGSIPESLIESELFGHVKGAFTGAQTNSIGKIKAADKGLLVLDEIGELPLSMQPKLLRFVQEKQITPVGSKQAIHVDVKIIAVTNRDLAFEVSRGKFRKDLFYRLNVVSLHSPPLRDRPEDIELLCQHFLSKFAHQFDTQKKTISEHTIRLLEAYDWPGNIRELENKLMQACLLTNAQEIKFNDLQLIDEFDQSPLYAQNNDTSVIPSSTARLNPQTKATSLNDKALPHSAQWQQQFESLLISLISALDEQTGDDVHAIGLAIEAYLLHSAYRYCKTHNQTALLVGLPISTARRRLLKLKLSDYEALSSYDEWSKLTHLLDNIANGTLRMNSAMPSIKNMLAKQILAMHHNNMSKAAKLMGVSEPTMYKYKNTFKIEGNAP